MHKSSYIKNTAVLTSGVVLAHIVPLIAYPLLSRLYSPEDFGLLSILTSITAILSIIATFHYDSAILITKSKRLAAELIITIQYLAIAFLIMSGLIACLFSDQISLVFNAPQIKYWLWICPICAYCLVLFNCYNEWCVKFAYFKDLSLNKIINGSAIPFGKIIFAFIKPFGLFIGELFGHLITGISCLVRVFRKERQFFNRPSKRHMAYLLNRYADCPKYVLPARLLNKTGLEIPIFLISAYYSVEELGYYTMASTLLVLPSKVIGKAITDTFRQKANLLIERDGNCRIFYCKVFLVLLLVSVSFFSVLYFIAPEVFRIVLGDNWIQSGYYCRILCFAMAIGLITDFGAALYYIREKMKLLLLWQIIYFTLTSCSMLIGVFYFNNMVSTLWCLVIGRCVAYSINGLFTFSLSK